MGAEPGGGGNGDITACGADVVTGNGSLLILLIGWAGPAGKKTGFRWRRINIGVLWGPLRKKNLKDVSTLFYFYFILYTIRSAS